MLEDPSAQRVVELYDGILKSRGRALSPASVILDYGCGSGRHAYEFLDAGFRHVFGYDVQDYVKLRSAADLERFRFDPTSGDGTEYPSMTKVPWPDNTFDFVFATQVFEHVSDQELAYSEVHRVLKPQRPVRGRLDLPPLSSTLRGTRHKRLEPGALHRRSSRRAQPPLRNAGRQLPVRTGNRRAPRSHLRRVRICRRCIHPPQPGKIAASRGAAQISSPGAPVVPLCAYASDPGAQAALGLVDPSGRLSPCRGEHSNELLPRSRQIKWLRNTYRTDSVCS